MIGSFGWFFLWFLLFIKVMPAVAIAEIKELVRPPLKSDEKENLVAMNSSDIVISPYSVLTKYRYY